jgi:hypothetical protein
VQTAAREISHYFEEQLSNRRKEIEQPEAKLTPEIRGWIDNVIVPAMVREWLTREEHANRVANGPKSVAQFEGRDVLSAEEIR